MTLEIHQAVFGYKNQAGHGLISTSLLDQDLMDKLRSMTDLPSNPPYGVDWDTYVSGFPVDKYYALTKTFPDHGFSRGDTVFTHVVLIKNIDVGKISDLRTIINLLPNAIDKTAIDLPSNVDIKEEQQWKRTSVNEKLVFHLANKNDAPIICIGSSTDYIDSICQIWSSLWSSLRLSLKFRIGFDPSTIKDDDVIIISPQSLEQGWGDLPIVQKDNRHKLSSNTELLLAGETKPSPSFVNMLNELGHSDLKLADLKMLDECSTLLEKTDDDSIRRLARNIVHLSPQKVNGQKLKARIITNLCTSIKRGTVKDILRLRNFSVTSFENGIQLLTESFDVWLKENITSTDSDVDKIINAAYLEADPDWWHQAIKNNVSSQFEEMDKKLGQLFWRLVDVQPDLVTLLFPTITALDRNEKVLLDILPVKLNQATIKKMIPFLVDNQWLLLHAYLITKIHPEKEAIESHLAVDIAHDYFDALHILSENVSIDSLIEYALERQDERVVIVVGKACSTNQKLFKNFDERNGTWRKIWLESINHNNTPWFGIIQPKIVTENLLDELTQGEVISENLLVQLSKTDYADISDYPSRKDIWKHVPLSSRALFIARTTDAVLTKAQKDFSLLNDLEIELINELKRRLAGKDFILSNKYSTALKVEVCEKFQVEEIIFEQFIKDNSTQFLATEADAIGELVSKHKWKSVARYVKAYKHRRNDLKPIWEKCSHLIKSSVWSIFSKNSSQGNSNKKAMSKCKILFMSAGPTDQDNLNLNQELRRIEDHLESAKHRDKFDMKAKVAVKFNNFTKSILEERPEIIHFSGHGNNDGLVLEKEDGKSHFLKQEVIEQFFSLLKDRIKCVLLNACYSKDQAKAISKHGIYVIGMSDRIEDAAAIAFSSGFYQSLGAGENIEFSFEWALAHIHAEANSNQVHVPELWLDGSVVGS